VVVIDGGGNTANNDITIKNKIFSGQNNPNASGI